MPSFTELSSRARSPIGLRRLRIAMSLNFFRMDVFDAPLTNVPGNNIRRPLVSRITGRSENPGSHTFSCIASHSYRADSRCAFSRDARTTRRRPYVPWSVQAWTAPAVPFCSVWLCRLHSVQTAFPDVAFASIHQIPHAEKGSIVTDWLPRLAECLVSAPFVFPPAECPLSASVPHTSVPICLGNSAKEPSSSNHDQWCQSTMDVKVNCEVVVKTIPLTFSNCIMWTTSGTIPKRAFMKQWL